MYFEARNHQSLPVKDAVEAVRLIHTGEVNSYQCPVWTNQKGHRIALVDDTHIDGPSFFEVAVVNLDTQEQYESLTFGWCNSAPEKLNLVLGCQEGHLVTRRSVSLPLDGNGRNKPAHFTCGCCGDRFSSTLQEQERFDQDAGYGICPSCAKDWP